MEALHHFVTKVSFHLSVGEGRFFYGLHFPGKFFCISVAKWDHSVYFLN